MSATMRRTDAKAFFGEASTFTNVAAGTLVLMQFLYIQAPICAASYTISANPYTHSTILQCLFGSP